MKAMPKLASLVALCCLLPLFALGEEPLFLDSNAACTTAPVATAQVDSGLLEALDPLQGATPRACTATATCGNEPSVMCSGTSSCTSKDRTCPNVSGWVDCDGNKTNCAVNGPCEAACEATRASCLAACPPGPLNPCRLGCHEDWMACNCDCYF
jgi:hypothetical protein